VVAALGGNYEKGIYKQLIEQIELTERLREENKALRAENNRLEKEVKRLQMKITEMESTMTVKIANCIEEATRLVTAPLIEELNKTHTEIDRLKAIINKDSSNS
jgi:cell division protein FtsB